MDYSQTLSASLLIAYSVNPSFLAAHPTDPYLLITTCEPDHTIHKLDLDSLVDTVVVGSSTYGALDGIGTAAQLYYPTGIAFTPDGSQAIFAEDENGRIRAINPSNFEVTTIAGSTKHAFGLPVGVGMHPSGTNVVFGGYGDYAGTSVRVVSLTDYTVTSLAGVAGSYSTGVGYVDATGDAARFAAPIDAAYTADASTVLVADFNNHVIRAIDVASSTVTTLAGDGTAGLLDGVGNAARFSRPAEIIISPDGSTAIVREVGNHAIRAIDLATVTVTTLVGDGTAASDAAFATFVSSNRLHNPRGIAFQNSSTLLVSQGSVILRFSFGLAS